MEAYFHGFFAEIELHGSVIEELGLMVMSVVLALIAGDWPVDVIATAGHVPLIQILYWRVQSVFLCRTGMQMRSTQLWLFGRSTISLTAFFGRPSTVTQLKDYCRELRSCNELEDTGSSKCKTEVYNTMPPSLLLVHSYCCYGSNSEE